MNALSRTAANLYEKIVRVQNYFDSHLLLKGPKNDDLVIEIGSGDNPRPRSDILVEKFLENSKERASHVMLDDRPMICGDIHNLPFKNNACDYVICSHLLEHLPEVGSAIDELSRIAKAGYIETPSSLSERLCGYPFHVWYVDKENSDQLIFNPKTQAIHDPQLAQQITHSYNTNEFFRLYCMTNETGLVKLHWKDQINYKVIKPVDQAVFDHADNAEEFTKPNQGKLKIFIKNIIRKIYALNSRKLSDKDLINMLQCPICHNDLSRMNVEYLTCKNNHRFPAQNNIYYVSKEYVANNV